MSTWRVLVQNWQIECCGTPPSVGDVVEWQLAWLEPAAGCDLAVTERMFAVTPWFYTPAGAEPTGTVLQSGSLTAWWDHPVPPVSRINLRGYLHEEHHDGVPEELPYTRGVVRRVEIATVTYARTDPGSRSWSPVGGTGRLRSVNTSPKLFADDQVVAESGAMTRSSEVGVVVTLEVSE